MLSGVEPVSDREVAAWVQDYVDAYLRAADMLLGIRRRGERAKACLQVLLEAATSLTSRAPEAIAAPSADHASELAGIAGTAWAARAVITDGNPKLNVTADSGLVDGLARRSAPWGGQLAPALMAASDGDLRILLYEGAVPELEAGVQAGRAANADWLVQPGFRIDHAAAFLAELNASARARPAESHTARAEALDQQIASAYPVKNAHISAHAFAVHQLTGIYGPGDRSARSAMLFFVATHPPHERATLQASKVATLLADAQGPRARMALLDHILLLLGPKEVRDPSLRMGLARDSALVLLLLNGDAADSGETPAIAVPVARTPKASSSGPPKGPQKPQTPIDRLDAAHHADQPGSDAIAEIAREAERAIAARAAERQERYQRAIDAESLADAIAIVRDAAADDDHEQAWLLLGDIVRRHPDAKPQDLVTVAPDVLGPVALDSEEDFDGPGAGCFTILSPAPADAAAALANVAPRLLNVDEQGTEHDDSDRAAQVTLDTKGSISAPMARTMIAIITDALVDQKAPALVTGWIPALDPLMTRWGSDD
jgi:hypothetical protein